MDIIPHPTKPGRRVAVVNEGEIVRPDELREFAEKYDLFERPVGSNSAGSCLLWVQYGKSRKCVPTSYRLDYLMRISSEGVIITCDEGIHVDDRRLLSVLRF